MRVPAEAVGSAHILFDYAMPLMLSVALFVMPTRNISYSSNCLLQWDDVAEEFKTFQDAEAKDARLLVRDCQMQHAVHTTSKPPGLDPDTCSSVPWPGEMRSVQHGVTALNLVRCGMAQASEDLQRSTLGLYDDNSGPHPLSDSQVCGKHDDFFHKHVQLLPTIEDKR